MLNKRRSTKRIFIWAAILLPHLIWAFYFLDASIRDGYRTSRLRTIETINEQLGAIYPLVDRGNPMRTELVQAITLNGRVQVHSQGPRFVQAGPTTLLFSENGNFIGVQGMHNKTSISSISQHYTTETAPPQSLSYSIYSLPVLFGERTLIAEGTRNYSPADILIEPGSPPNIKDWGKSLDISHGFSLGTRVYREANIRGFGLWVDASGYGHSWEWFDLNGGDTYSKRQGSGRVIARKKTVGGEEEITSIEFLDDITLRLAQDVWWRGMPFIDKHKDTHHLIVKKGSVFWLAPDD